MYRIALCCVAGLLCATAWSADYLMEGADNGRTGWLKGDKSFTVSNVRSMKLLWKTKLESMPREMHNLFPPLIASGVSTGSGAKEILVVAGVSDDLFAVDAATGAQLWRKHFSNTWAPDGDGRSGGTLCPGGQLAVPAMGATGPGKYTIYAVSWDGRLWQVNAADGREVALPEKFVPPNGKPYALNLQRGVVYASTAQGCGGVTHMFLSFDLKTRRTSVFLPSGGGLWGRRGVALSHNGTVYMGTGDGQFDPESGHFGNGLVAVKHDETGELKLTGYYGPSNADWLWKRDLDINVSPMSFDHKGRHFVAGTSKECRVWLLDRDQFGGDDHRTALFRTPLVCNDMAHFAGLGVWGAMAFWEDAKGDGWLAVPFYGPVSSRFHAPVEAARPEKGGVAAFRLEEKGGTWQLTPAWLSKDTGPGEEAIQANGVLFTYSSGEDVRVTREDRAWNEPAPVVTGPSSLRIADSTHATLYALDAATGKELWSSGDQITSWNHFSGISAANGKVYIPTFDGNVYCFGVGK
jgi:outer membrane protein assembly factor BamB